MGSFTVNHLQGRSAKSYGLMHIPHVFISLAACMYVSILHMHGLMWQ
jgi:hypothetical protein